MTNYKIKRQKKTTRQVDGKTDREIDLEEFKNANKLRNELEGEAIARARWPLLLKLLLLH